MGATREQKKCKKKKRAMKEAQGYMYAAEWVGTSSNGIKIGVETNSLPSYSNGDGSIVSDPISFHSICSHPNRSHSNERNSHPERSCREPVCLISS